MVTKSSGVFCKFFYFFFVCFFKEICFPQKLKMVCNSPAQARRRVITQKDAKWRPRSRRTLASIAGVSRTDAHGLDSSPYNPGRGRLR